MYYAESITKRIQERQSASVSDTKLWSL